MDGSFRSWELSKAALVPRDKQRYFNELPVLLRKRQRPGRHPMDNALPIR